MPDDPESAGYLSPAALREDATRVTSAIDDEEEEEEDAGKANKIEIENQKINR